MSEEAHEAARASPGNESPSTEAGWERLQAYLSPTHSTNEFQVIMLCGIAGQTPTNPNISHPSNQTNISNQTPLPGSGKSTLSVKITQQQPSSTRLSIDGIIAERHGIYAVDYPAHKYAVYQEEADVLYLEKYKALLAAGKGDVVLDRSFYARKDRALFQSLAETNGYRVVLVYLDVDREALWRRICDRQKKARGADNALDIDRTLLDRFCEGFEVPSGEGEIVFRST